MKISQTHTMRSYFLYALIFSVLLFGLLIALYPNTSNNFIENWLPPSLITFFVLSLLFSVNLSWELDTNGFSYRFLPFIWSIKFIPIQEIQSIEVLDIRPLRDFGGWGLRWSFKYGKAYTTSGKTVIRLTLKNGELINFTTSKDTNLSELKDKLPQIK